MTAKTVEFLTQKGRKRTLGWRNGECVHALPVETNADLRPLKRMPALPLRRNDVAHKELVLALSIIVAASPVSAAGEGPTPTIAAPAGTPDTKYCMRIEAITGSRLEEVKCWTREEWAEQGVDVDKDWAKEGVRTIG